jgi:hypothetical protein
MAAVRGVDAVKTAGKLWFRFYLFGLDWEARILPADHKLLKHGKHKCMATCFYNHRLMVFADDLSQEQYRVTFAHELQHAIEDHADVDYEEGVAEDVHDRWTDQVARGWVYVMRHCPHVIEYLQAKRKGPDG